MHSYETSSEATPGSIDAGHRESLAKPVLKVVVIEDAPLMRKMIQMHLERDSQVKVVGTAGDGQEGLEAVQRHHPDVVTLDLEMPRMNGMKTLEELRRKHPRVKVLMLSVATKHGAEATFDALQAGAHDYLPKPSGNNDSGLFAMSLRQKVRQFMPHAERETDAPVAAGNSRPAKKIKRRILAIGTSTGGPTALTHLLAELPSDFPLPIVVTQHMPSKFTTMFAQRLQSQLKLQVAEAAQDMPVERGQVLIAPGDYHLELGGTEAKPRIRLTQGPPEHFCRPAVDVMLRSVHRLYGGGVLVSILTGMGSDGLEGVRLLKKSGAWVTVQDSASSVVWGMPGAVAKAGLADSVLTLEAMAHELVRQTE